MPLLAVRGNGPAGAYGFGAASGKPAAMTAIASTTLTTDQLTVTLSSIPGTYDDLRLVIYDSGDTTYSYSAGLRFNSDSANNYSWTRIEGDGSTAYSLRVTSNAQLSVQTRTQPSATVVDIVNYSNTSNYKTSLIRTAVDNNGSGETNLSCGLWRSTSAITSISLHQSALRYWSTGSVFALYGIKKAA